MNLGKHIYIVLLLLCGGDSIINAEGVTKTSSLIDQARKINFLDKMVNVDRKIDLNTVKSYLEDQDPTIRAVTLHIVADLNNPTIEKLINEKERDTVWFVRRERKIAVKIKELEKINSADRWRYLATISNGNVRLARAFSLIYLKKGWARSVDEIESIVPKSKVFLSIDQKRMEAKNNISALPQAKKKKQAIQVLLGQTTNAEKNEAIQALTGLGKNVIPDILLLLKDVSNIPTSAGPPWNQTHSRYSAILLALKCIPDERSIPVLMEFVGRKELFLSKEAKDTLLWVKSNVPYPLRYEEILINSEDDVPPGE